jgi:hypothetical protein
MDIGLEIDPLIERWNLNYQSLKIIYESGSNPNISRVKGIKNNLADWLKEQRKRKKAESYH